MSCNVISFLSSQCAWWTLIVLSQIIPKFRNDMHIIIFSSSWARHDSKRRVKQRDGSLKITSSSIEHPNFSENSVNAVSPCSFFSSQLWGAYPIFRHTYIIYIYIIKYIYIILLVTYFDRGPYCCAQFAVSRDAIRRHDKDSGPGSTQRLDHIKLDTPLPIGSMYAIYGNIYHQYTPNVSIYTIHASYGL